VTLLLLFQSSTSGPTTATGAAALNAAASLTASGTNAGPSVGMAQWYKADDLALADGAGVASWPDASGNGRSLTPTATSTPTFVASAVGGKPGVRFTAAGSQYLQRTTGLGTLFNAVTGITALAVIAHKGRATGDTQQLYFAAVGVAGSTGTTRFRAGYGATTGAPSPGGRRLDADAFENITGTAGTALALDAYGISTQVVDYGAAQTSAYRDGARVLGPLAILTPGAVSATSSVATRIAAQNSTTGFFDGVLVELLVYPRALTNAERAQTHAYLAGKYGITVTEQATGSTTGNANLVASSSLTATGNAATAAAATLTATASLAVSATSSTIGTAAADLVAASALDVSGVLERVAATDLAADATLTAAADLARLANAVLVADATLTAAADLARLANAVLVADATLTAAADLARLANAVLVADATLTSPALRGVAAPAAFDAVATLTAIGVVVAAGARAGWTYPDVSSTTKPPSGTTKPPVSSITRPP
jgi:hypothetical protein